MCIPLPVSGDSRRISCCDATVKKFVVQCSIFRHESVTERRPSFSGLVYQINITIAAIAILTGSGEQ